MFLAAELKEEGWDLVTAETGEQAWQQYHHAKPGVVLLDYLLGADDGLKLAFALRAHSTETQIIMMTGGGLSDEELDLCRENDLPILFKPFIAMELVSLIKNRQRRPISVAAGAQGSAQPDV
jgi:DNA-binding response OmpR family regulator